MKAWVDVTPGSKNFRVRWSGWEGDGPSSGSRKGFATREAGAEYAKVVRKYGPIKAELLAFGVAVRKEPVTAVAKDDPTVREIVEKRLRFGGGNDVTKRKNLFRARTYIFASLEGAAPLGDQSATELRREAVIEWMERVDRFTSPKTGKTLAQKEKEHIHSVLSSSFKYAIEDRDCPVTYNPAMKVTPSETAKVIKQRLTREEVFRLLDCVPAHWQDYVLLLAATGMRSQEINALTVRQVDFSQGLILIDSAVKYGTNEIGTTKSGASRRNIPLPPECRAMLIKRCEGRHPDAYVFLNTEGRRVLASTFHENAWKRTVHEFAGDKRIETKPRRGRTKVTYEVDPKNPSKRPTPHDLRHAYAKLAVLDGVPPVAVQRQLGHEDVRTTLNIYAQVSATDFQNLGNVLRHPHLKAVGE